MGVEIIKNQLVFSIPNSEAVLSVQRITDKKRCVGSYYLSQKTDEVEAFLNGLVGNFYIDLGASYLYCHLFYEDLINNCKSLYYDDLFYLDEALRQIEWSIKKAPEALFFKTSNPVIIEKRKYIKLPSQDANVGLFRNLCLGEISELIIEKLSIDCFKIYVRPKKEAVPFVRDIKSYKNWLMMKGKIK